MKKNSKTTSQKPDPAPRRISLRPLYSWFEKNKRDLPFRRTGDPYRIWISEVMLQQTRVAAMLERYAAFIEQFPSVEALAAAPEEQVLAAWKGLGYYSRARNLRLAAIRIAEQGAFPDTLAGMMALPGVGIYTASAVLSIARGLPHAVVDGNVIRVFSRLFYLDTEQKRRQIQSLAAEFIQGTDPSVHNQAIMELGALVCLPGRPLCDTCPLARSCEARKRGGPEIAARLPPKKVQKKTPALIEFLARWKGGKLLFVRDPASRFLRNQWILPARILIGGRTVTGHWSGASKLLHTVRHSITDYAVQASLRSSRSARMFSGLEQTWLSLEEARETVPSSLVRKLLLSL